MNPFDRVIHISIRPKGIQPKDVTPTRLNMVRLALRWDFLMRNRSRWIEDEELRAKVAQRSRKHLLAIDVNESFLAALARAGQVEVSHAVGPTEAQPAGDKPAEQTPPERSGFLPSLFDWLLDPFVDRTARRMPWESLLTMAARKYQNHERFVVYRRLLGLPSHSETAALEAPVKALFVESAPGKLLSIYNFDLEYLAVQTYLVGVELSRLRHPSLDELRAHVGKNKPSIIHLTGIDGYQGFQLLKELQDNGAASAAKAEIGQEPTRPKEGVYFRDDSGQPKVESLEAVAEALCAGGHRPLLVTFNLWNSSAGLAAATVKMGAAAAIGFQDFIDDTVAEIFFANLFFAWSRNPSTPLLEAFDHAVRELHAYTGKVRGSGVTLWTREPLLDKTPATPLHLPPLKLKKRANRGRGDGAPDAVLHFDVQPYPALNYSVLHNSPRQMFETFRIYKFSPDPVKDIRVEVNLSMGAETFGFRGTFTMEHHILDLSERIAVGLTSSLTRSLRESVRTTVFVRVTVGPNDERFCDTFDVSLLAVDEWKDDQMSVIFLPSFVLPRDPLISSVIANAQRYLMALADDFSQGFDGYQSRDDHPEDPASALEVQARAIWYALQHDFALKYINPPPTFSDYSQRLRTPSDILKGGRGTCIDLALVLAACFEYVGLRPVIFLMKGHAFVGYWTGEDRQDEFRTTTNEPLLSEPDDLTRLPSDQERLEAENPDSFVPRVVWVFDKFRRRQIVEAVERGDLVALEATYLTNGGGFSDACEVGVANLNNEREFESMIDITLAREESVTPLPLVLEEGGR